MKLLFLFSILFSVQTSLARSGGPKEINCEVTAWRTSLSPAYLQTLIKKACGEKPVGSCSISNVILGYSERFTLQELTRYKCDLFDGKVSTCLAYGKVQDSAWYSYGFNTQFGALQLTDNVTGNRVSANWLNQHDVTKSGYLHVRVSLTNYKGGIFGDPKIWEVEANCWAAKW